MEEEKKKGLKSTTIGLMVGVALFFDTIKAILDIFWLGIIVLPFAYGTFWLWFKFNGLNFFSLKRAPTIGIGLIIEILPWVSVIPAITFTVLRVALDAKFKEEVANRVMGNTVDRLKQSGRIRERKP